MSEKPVSPGTAVMPAPRPVPDPGVPGLGFQGPTPPTDKVQYASPPLSGGVCYYLAWERCGSEIARICWGLHNTRQLRAPAADFDF